MASQLAQILTNYRQTMPNQGAGLASGVGNFFAQKQATEIGAQQKRESDIKAESDKFDLFEKKYGGQIAAANTREKWLSAQNSAFLPKEMDYAQREPFLMGMTMRRAGQNVSASQREFENLIKDFSEEEKKKARRVKAGLKARAVGTGAATTAQEGLTDLVAESESKIAGAKAGATETAKLTAQLKLEPAVKSAVETAISSAKQVAEQAGEQRSNAIAFNVYNTAMNGLISSLSDTTTGPVAGFLPAVTANQQIADGAVAAMAPVLKQLFRSAGEGNFTDKDQELLLEMVPTRKDKPESRLAKISNIDAIVRAKLSQGQQAQQAEVGVVGQPAQSAARPTTQTALPPVNDQGWQLMTDAQGNQAYVGPNGEVQEVR